MIIKGESALTGYQAVRSSDLQLIQAARELIEAYERQSTANEHFLKLEAAVDALGGTGGQTRADQDPATPSTTG